MEEKLFCFGGKTVTVEELNAAFDLMNKKFEASAKRSASLRAYHAAKRGEITAPRLKDDRWA